MNFSSLQSFAIDHFYIGSRQYLLFNTVDKIAESWDHITYHDLYFSSAYLKVIQNSPSLGISPYYLLEFEDDQLKAAYYYQLKSFKLDESMAANQKVKTDFIKRQFSKILKFKTLVNGNLLLTGKYGYCNPSNEKINIQHLEKINNILSEKIEQITQVKLQGILAKDFYPNQLEDIDYKGDYVPLVVHPNMVMTIDSVWRNFDDYLEALNTKYRTRVKRAHKKLFGVETRELSLEDVIAQNPSIVQLYKNIALNADFNLFILPDNYFIDIKKVFKEKFVIKGYFKENELIGFFTCLKNYGHLDAHFLGYDIKANTHHQLYLNMLLDMVKLGIRENCQKILMSRTAIEIKNSVGAEPQEMICFFKYNNIYINPLVKPIFEYFKPNNKITTRSPFKNVESAQNDHTVKVKEKRGLAKILCKK